MTGRDNTTAAAVSQVLPSQEEIEAAARILMRAWSPSTLLPDDADHDAQVDDYDYDNECGCAGEDAYGNDRGCNCGDGCTCSNCEAYEWKLNKQCSARTGSTRCGVETKYRVVAFRLVPTVLGDSSEGAVCPHGEGGCRCRPGCVFLDAGPIPEEHQHLPACSVGHAQQIVARMQEVYGEPADKPTRLRYRIEAWTYEPHWTELPEHLASLPGLTRDAQAFVSLAIRNPGKSRENADYWLQAMRENLALAAWRVARPVPEDLADEVCDAGPGNPDA